MRTAAIGIVLAIANAPADAAETISALAPELATMGLRINGEAMPGIVYLVSRNDRVYLDSTAFGALDLVGQAATHSSIELAGKRYIDLGSVAGLTYRIDPARQELVLDIAPTALAGTKTALKLGSSLRPRRPDWGGFANYTVFGYADRGNNFGPGSQYLSGAGEVAVFGPYGTGLISAIANPSVFGYGEQAKLVRLDTNWRYDDIDKMRTLTVGDGSACPEAGAVPCVTAACSTVPTTLCSLVS